MPNEQQLHHNAGEAFTKATGLLDGFSSPENPPNQSKTAIEARGGGTGLQRANLELARDTVIVPGTSLTLGAAERLENAAQNLVALGNLFADEACVVDDKTVPRLPPILAAALGRMNGILAGPGPVALDRRPNSVEVVGDPVLHECALIEARAREIARAGVTDEQRAASDAYESQQHAHLEDVRQAFEEGKSQGYNAGCEHAESVRKRMIEDARRQSYDHGFGQGIKEADRQWCNLTLWQLIRCWWRGVPEETHGRVGGIDRSTLSYWKNHFHS